MLFDTRTRAGPDEPTSHPFVRTGPHFVQPKMMAGDKEAAGVEAPTAEGTAELTSHPARASVPRPIAAIYVRQSRTDEEDQYRNISPDMQEQACRKLPDVGGHEI